MVHLERRAKMTHRFRNPFRKEDWQQWEVDHAKPYELPEHVLKDYAGNIESHDAYTNYNSHILIQQFNLYWRAAHCGIHSCLQI